MVGEKFKTYLVSGGSLTQRRKIINNIKRDIFTGEKSRLRAVTLYAGDINLDSFKDLVFTLSFQKKKVVLIKDFISLSKPIRKFLFENIQKILNYNYIIFESEIPYFSLGKKKKIASDSLFKYIIKNSKRYNERALPAEISIEDFRNQLYRNNLSSCLFILEELLSSKTKSNKIAPQILGLIIAKFSYLKNSDNQEEAFNQLWQADRALKQSNIDIRILIERLLIKLFT
ncbi:MAG: hypothetical protein K9L80_00875 [Candidatus Omnitrophica bacterium]|nr:hypothetical protein [Candidatus Omnitrophota bacterium]MCF7887782.1 hypothetical protein [Candidatus Omnitrophota bacterium]